MSDAVLKPTGKAGAKRKVDQSEVVRLRGKGLSSREICKLLKVEISDRRIRQILKAHGLNDAPEGVSLGGRPKGKKKEAKNANSASI